MRIAVTGCGSIGRRHLQNLKYLGCEDLIAFDPAPEARQSVEQELGIPVFKTLNDLWSQQPEVVLVAAPTNLHLEIAQEAASRGCHLFIEKPLSHSLEGVHTLEKEVQKRDLVAMVGCNMRFHPGPAAIKRMIEEKVVGRAMAARLQTGSYLPGWRPRQDYRQSYSASAVWGGAILDCIHEIDLALWYFGPATVVGAAWLPATAIDLETDGLAEILLWHQSRMLCNVHLNFIQRDYRRTCQVIGTEGTIYWNFNDHRVKVLGPDGGLIKEVPEPPGWQLKQMYVDELDHFLKAVQKLASPSNPIAGGAAALKIALAVKENYRM